jgi:hypothetical protein
MVNFRNITFYIILMGILSVANAMAMEVTQMHVPVQKNYQYLKSIGERYVAFLQKVGQSDNPITPDEVAELFAPQCTKIVNGSIVLNSSRELSDQLKTAREALGAWRINTLLITASPDDGTCTIQIKWEDEKMKQYTTMMVLFIDDMGKISQIHEVYSEYKDSQISDAYNEHKKNAQGDKGK